MVSILLPVKNVEGIIADCLDGVQWANEVIVIDGHSTDATREIASAYKNVRIVSHESSDIRVKTSETEPLARNSWIFWLHADEIVTPALGEEILASCGSAPTSVGGFSMPTRDIIFGVEWGAGATWGRIWRKGCAKFRFQAMHEMPVIDGDIIPLKHFYWHINNPNVRTFLPKLLQYEYVDARNATDEKCLKINPSFWYQLIRFFYFAVRLYWPKRHLGYPATAYALSAAFGHILRHLLLVEEIRIRRGLTKRGTHGWG